METDDDRALQPERTGLAWVRTLVVIAGTWGLVAFHAVQDHGWVSFGAVAAAVAVVILITAGWIGTRRGRRARVAMSADASVAAPLGLLSLSIMATAVATVALISSLPLS